MSKKTVAFVVFHYVSYELTEECLESILALETASSPFKVGVVVVDNASGNGSYEALCERFGGHGAVELISNDENLGFSRANNRGFEHARSTFDPSCIAVVNNDTAIRDPRFLDKLAASMERCPDAYVIGPDIYVERRGYHQNPFLDEIPDRSEMEARLERCIGEEGGMARVSLKQRIKRTLMRVGFMRERLDERSFKARRKFDGWRTPSEGGALHGVAVVFTDRFLETGEQPFDPPTFLYEEETILALRCRRNGWRCVYDPSLQVMHFDDGSTDIVYEDYGRKAAFLRRNEMESIKVLLSQYEVDGSDGRERR